MWNSIEKKRKTQWAECWNRPSRRAQRRYFSAFFSQIGGRVNCRWRRRRQSACAVAAHPLRWESPPFRTKAQNAELLSLRSLSLSLSLGSPVRIFPHCRGQRQTGTMTLSTPVMSDRGCVEMATFYVQLCRKIRHRQSSQQQQPLRTTTAVRRRGRNNITNLSAVAVVASTSSSPSLSLVAGFGNRSLF